jgi:transcriptional regulator with XRE-family HTH domain
MFLTQMPSLTPPDKTLALALRRARERRNKTQEGIAYEAGVTVTTLGRIERARINPSWTTVRDIANALDLTLVELARAVEQEEG